MSKYYVTNERTEDTFCATDDLQEAIQKAKEIARSGQAGDLVLVESSEGKGVRQFVLKPDGTVSENKVA
jgi:hypothetical protein